MKKHQISILLFAGFAACLLSCGKPGTSGTVSERISVSQNQCYLFDKESGRFLGSVGRIGNGPGESPSLQGWLNYPAGRIYSISPLCPKMSKL